MTVYVYNVQKGREEWVDVLRQHCADLEIGLAQEHQHRVRQEREKVSCLSVPCSWICCPWTCLLKDVRQTAA